MAEAVSLRTRCARPEEIGIEFSVKLMRLKRPRNTGAKERVAPPIQTSARISLVCSFRARGARAPEGFRSVAGGNSSKVFTRYGPTKMEICFDSAAEMDRAGASEFKLNTVQRGKTRERTGRANALTITENRSKCRVAAERRLSMRTAAAPAEKRTKLLMAASAPA